VFHIRFSSEKWYCCSGVALNLSDRAGLSLGYPSGKQSDIQQNGSDSQSLEPGHKRDQYVVEGEDKSKNVYFKGGHWQIPPFSFQG
jgi:hypothetical protein